MSIDKDSTGLPEVNLHHADTKINLGIVIGVLVFLGAMAGVTYFVFL